MKKSKIVSLVILFCLLFATPVFADTNYGEKAGTWVLEQVFWVGLIFIAIALVGLLIKRHYTGAVITIFAGAIILYFIKQPEKLVDIGTALAGVVGF